MNRAFVLPPNEGWIIDRFVHEWNRDNADITTLDPSKADVVWLFADFCWTRLPAGFLRTKKVITTIHHIVPEKFVGREVMEFEARDELTSVYHVPNDHTRRFIEPLTKKPIVVLPYWANDAIWRRTGDKHELRQKHGIPLHAYVVGSFQRDTEGHDLESPKLEKGPDLLGDFLDTMKESEPNLHVVLGGWRRHYIIGRLKESGIPFTYVEKPPQPVINELYQTLDLYPVTARYEGGPQSLIEAGLLGVPVVSRDVGMATQLLPSSAVADDVSVAIPAVPSVDHLRLPHGYEPFRRLIESL